MLTMLVAIAVTGPFIGFMCGMLVGQRSVRVLPVQTERLVVSDRLTVERTVPVDNAKAVPVTRVTDHEEYMPAVPPMYKDLVGKGDKK